jgi:hypothetical protein
MLGGAMTGGAAVCALAANDAAQARARMAAQHSLIRWGRRIVFSSRAIHWRVASALARSGVCYRRPVTRNLERRGPNTRAFAAAILAAALAAAISFDRH